MNAFICRACLLHAVDEATKCCAACLERMRSHPFARFVNVIHELRRPPKKP